MWWSPSQRFGWWILFGGIWMVLCWGVIIGLVVWAVRAMTEGRSRPSEDESPLRNS